MTPEQQKLCSLIDGHCAAMKAQVVDPGAKLEFFAGDHGWRAIHRDSATLFEAFGTLIHSWCRLAPTPRLIDLDQSDFIGANRVTHLRQRGCDYAAIVEGFRPHCAVVSCCEKSFESLRRDFECSRDNGATWGPCSKEAK